MAEKQYISVQELSEYLGVSVQYVYKLLNKQLLNYSTMVKGKKVLKISVLESEWVKQKLLNNRSTVEVVSKQVESSTESHQESRTELLIDTLNKVIADQKETIAEQNRTIERLLKQIEQMAILVENSQKLQLVDKMADQELKEQTEPEECRPKRWSFWRK